MSHGAEINILLIEDDEIDVRAVKRAFQEQKIANPIHVAADGVDALALLRGNGGRERLPRPCLILLDLKLPRMNGIQFLRELRADPALRDNIVFVLTGSEAEEDKVAAYENHVAGYLLKSNVGGEFMNAVRMIGYFVGSVQFPSKK